MKKVERLNRELAYHGVVVDVYADTVRVPNGTVAKWDFIGHVGAAAVVPVLDDGRVVMVKQYRNALDRFTLEIPAGKLDAPGEPMEECAARELEEESGYRCDHLEYLLTLNTTVAFCNEKIGVYVARNLIPSHQHLDADEDVEVSAWRIEDLLEKIYAGEMTDAKTVAALLAYWNKYVRG